MRNIREERGNNNKKEFRKTKQNARAEQGRKKHFSVEGRRLKEVCSAPQLVAGIEWEFN